MPQQRKPRCFNPRPREEGDGRQVNKLPVILGFNPRPREEGDAVVVMFCVTGTVVSIHALVKRATASPHLRRQFLLVSIHALVKRATPDCFTP